MVQLRLALRSLFKTPIVTAIAVLSVALGIGANVAIFSIFNQTLLRPLPVHEPDRLVNLVSPGPRSGSSSCGQAGSCDAVFSYPMFRDLERVQTSFTGLAAHRDFGANLSYRGSSEGGDGVLVSGSYFPVLGLTPAAGRLLGPNDEREQGGGHVVVLSEEYWRRRFGAREEVIDQPLLVNGQALTIVGVAPRGFHGTTLGVRPLFFVPISMRDVVQPQSTVLGDRRAYWTYLFGRLKPGVSREQAREALNGQYRPIMTDVEVPLQKGMSEATLEKFRVREMQLETGERGQSRVPEESRQPLTLLFSVTIIVLLICCANVANLLLGRAARRSTEMAVRLSIGAGRRHIVTQLLTESLLLAVVGGVAGLLVARWTLAAMSQLLPDGAGETLSLALDADMLLVAAGLSVTTGLLFGLFPAIHSTRPNLVTALKANAGQPSGARAAARFRITLATAQIALSMALLIAAGLFTKSLANITRVDLGLKTEQLVVFGVAPMLNGYAPQRSHEIFARIEDRLRALPGVTGVTSSMVRLASGDAWGTSFSVQGFAAGPDTDTQAMYTYVGPDYLRTLGVPLLSGREITNVDTLNAPKVALVNDAFVKKFNLGRDAVGKRIARGRGSKLDIEIVGVSGNTTYNEVKGDVQPLVAFPYRQDEKIGSTHFYVRTTGSDDDLVSAIPRVVRDIDPTLPVADVQKMSLQVLETVSLDRFVTTMSAAFAALATLLAALGLYGVLAYTVTQRTREFGLRMALGADAANVRRLVLRQVAVMTGVGALIGLTSALALGRAAESLLFQMNARDPFVFAAATLVLAAVALCAGLIPAQRAARVDPMTALRYE
ncbi:MAG TPA: ABC transporter permease [Vicinamibacterales bacterium]